mmetsp:Transcript_24416/g.61034  ORF Transcript_24416/g.61034 Transcript_24416/m.61034 type:complete len:430 (+) Transcript_24416:437-1726(+)
MDRRVEDGVGDLPDPRGHPEKGRGDDQEEDQRLSPPRRGPSLRGAEDAQVAHQHAAQRVEDVVRQRTSAAARDDRPLLPRGDVKNAPDAAGLQQDCTHSYRALREPAHEAVADCTVHGIHLADVVPSLRVQAADRSLRQRRWGPCTERLAPWHRLDKGDPHERRKHGHPSQPAPRMFRQLPPPLFGHRPEDKEREPSEDCIEWQTETAHVAKDLEARQDGAPDPGRQQRPLEPPPERQDQPPSDQEEQVPEGPNRHKEILDLPTGLACALLLPDSAPDLLEDVTIPRGFEPRISISHQQQHYHLAHEVDGADLDDAVNLPGVRQVRRRGVARDEDVCGHQEGQGHGMKSTAEPSLADKETGGMLSDDEHRQEKLGIVQNKQARRGLLLGSFIDRLALLLRRWLRSVCRRLCLLQLEVDLLLRLPGTCWG